MKHVMCAVRDSAVGSFMRPFFVAAAGSAVRAFGDEVARSDGPAEGRPMNAHPEDYELFELGSFDDESGSVVMLDFSRSLARGKDFVKES